MARRFAMSVLGNGLSDAKHHKDALSVREAELSLLRRIGAPQNDILLVKGNVANTYQLLERREDALTLRREVYSECVNLHGEEHFDTIREANNYASSLHNLRRLCRRTLFTRRPTGKLGATGGDVDLYGRLRVRLEA